jgi:hypothetical protein
MNAVLIAHEELEAGARRDEISHVLGVPMIIAGGAQPGTGVVDLHGSVHDLLSGIVIDVGHRHAVRALPCIGAACGVRGRDVAVKLPELGELPVTPVPGAHRGACIVTARHDEARQPRAIEVCGRR